jgi:hypothetical protein
MVSGVIGDDPSVPENFMSLSATVDVMTKSLDEFEILPNSVPASLKDMSAPSASKIMSPPGS